MVPQEQDFDELWKRYMPEVPPAVYAVEGWDVARILGDLRASKLSEQRLMDAANAIAAGLEKRGYPSSYEVDTVILTTAHAMGPYGVPVAVIEGTTYGPGDPTPAGTTAGALVADWAARFNGQTALPLNDPQTAMETAAAALGKIESRSWAGWLTTILQALEGKAPEEDFCAALRALQGGIETRLSAGRW